MSTPFRADTQRATRSLGQLQAEIARLQRQSRRRRGIRGFVSDLLALVLLGPLFIVAYLIVITLVLVRALWLPLLAGCVAYWLVAHA